MNFKVVPLTQVEGMFELTLAGGYWRVVCAVEPFYRMIKLFRIILDPQLEGLSQRERTKQVPVLDNLGKFVYLNYGVELWGIFSSKFIKM